MVKDFSTALADIIDLTDILGAAYNPLSDAIADFVSFSTSSGSTFVSVDRDGTAGVYSMAQIIKLENVTGLASAETLETNGNLIAASPASASRGRAVLCRPQLPCMSGP